MTEGVTFDEDALEGMVRIYRTPSMRERRHHIREALSLEPGERVLSIGCGPGFEPRGFARDVGEAGRVLGVDTQEAMLTAARERCADHEWTGFERGSAADLPVEDGTFDAAAAVQVLEYVPDLDAAFAELSRALRPGGRALVFDSDWRTMTYHADDEDRSDRILSAFDAHCPHPRLARTLRPRLERAGFEVTDVEAFVHLETALDDDSVGWAFVPLVTAFVTEVAGIDDADAEAWAADLEARGDAGEFFFSFTQYGFTAEKPG